MVGTPSLRTIPRCSLQCERFVAKAVSRCSHGSIADQRMERLIELRWLHGIPSSSFTGYNGADSRSSSGPATYLGLWLIATSPIRSARVSQYPASALAQPGQLTDSGAVERSGLIAGARTGRRLLF